MKNIDNIKLGTITVEIIFNKENRRKSMIIKNVKIKGVGGIKDLYLDFHKGLNIICGANGIGKTTILESIAHNFSSSGNKFILKRNKNCDCGSVEIEVALVDETMMSLTFNDNYSIEEFRANKYEDANNNNFYYNRFLLVFKTNRQLEYNKLNGITSDKELSNFDIGRLSINGIGQEDIKEWFINRFIFSRIDDFTQVEQKHNIELASKCFEILDNKISFSRILSDSLDIMVNTPQGEVYFEYLSSGYKSCFYILLGIIKEIEYRFKEPCIKVEDFEGVILIDELDLHLHPEWQAKIISSLKIVVPKAQIIATTHSPNMIQTLSPNEIIPLIMDENGNVRKKDLELGEYGLQGWTIEEILTDVMGMKTTSSELYLDTMRKFDRAMDKENIDEIKKYYDILMKMLHPNSTLRTILKIQVAGIID
ncbi:TPA: AAA family ATPase [Clostridioides difficile]|nr:AAA family ATPase [Clostridioides difficile]HEK8704886.1 AAA family ATPase [Clostridioides difficile]